VTAIGLGIVLDAARDMTCLRPITSAAHQLFRGLSAAGQGGRDDAFVMRFWQMRASIDRPRPKQA
jgi:3-hydroxyisobutyrate dehydrogenase